MNSSLRVAINAQLLPSSGAGGIETVLVALSALGHLDDGPEEYLFVGPAQQPDWLLDSWRGPRMKIIAGPSPAPPPVSPVAPSSEPLRYVKSALAPLRPLARGVKRYLSTVSSKGRQTGGRGPLNFYEKLNCDVVHFPFQYFEPCAMPAIFNPHDLQHLHYPAFFDEAEILRRETTYRAACEGAHTVVVASKFVKHDVVKQYGIAPERVRVIPWSPPPVRQTSDAARSTLLADAREKYRLPREPFALYPAMTWEHKNHLRLLEAMALLRDRDALEVNLVCTGHQTDFWPHIEQRISELKLTERVRFLGQIPYVELPALYRAAQFVVIPTLFEAASAPLFEAWQQGVPVACSRVTSLPEQAGDAALLFDPASVDSIAAAVARMSTDAMLRADLRRRGTRRLQDFSLERTAKSYRAVYRRAAGRALNEEDRELLRDEGLHENARAVEVQTA